MLESLRYRLRALFRRRQIDEELSAELAFHIERETEENVAAGMGPAEARRQAALAFGGVETIKETHRDRRGARWVEHAIADTRYGLRGLARNPGFAAIAIISLALGIGANTAIFSLTDLVFFKALPVTRPGELVVLQWSSGPVSLDRSIDGTLNWDPAGRRTTTSFSMPAFESLRGHTNTLGSVFAFAPIEQLDVATAGGADIATGEIVTGEYFSGLGVQPLRGRLLGPGDDRPESPPAAVISAKYWRQRFAGDTTTVGSIVSINGTAFSIVGITPPMFEGVLNVGQQPDVTVPMALLPLVRQGGARDLADAGFWWVRIMGRMRPGVSRDRVRAEIEPRLVRSAINGAPMPSLAQHAVNLPRLEVLSGAQGLTDQRSDYGMPLLILSIVAGLLLLIACVNVANLLLTRAAARQREITMRLALGASRSRIVKQLLVESLLLAASAEALGLVIAYWGKNLLVTLRPDLAGVELTLDRRVLAIATAISLGTALLFGLAPAFRATRVDLADRLKEHARNVHASRSFFSRALVVMQIAMSVVLLIDGALFLRTLRNLRDVKLGFNADHLLTFRVDARLSGYDATKIPDVYRTLVVKLQAIPGVRSVTFTRHPQLSRARRSDEFTIVGADMEAHELPIDLVGPGFFETMQLPIVLGRAFTSHDDEHAPMVAIVNEAFVRTYLPGMNPIGRILAERTKRFTIVGVARDAKYYSIRKGAEPIVYVSYFQQDQGQASFALRTAGDPLAIVSAARQAALSVDRTLAIFEVRTQRETLETTLTQERLLATLSTVFGALAVLLACVGVYGIVSYTTAQRTGEIGIRIALGASGRNVVWLVMQRTVLLVFAGVVAGVAAGAGGARLFANMLYDVRGSDPVSIAAAIATIAIVAFAASYIPARRARSVSPMAAIRVD